MAPTFWHIRNCSLFARLADAELDLLERHSRLRKFPKGGSIYLPTDASDCAFLLGEGRIRLCATTPEGKQSILAFVEPGELFGELALIDPGQREERAEATIGSTVLLIPGELLRQMMEESAKLTLGVTKLIGLRRKRVERRLRSLLFRNNRDRLTHLLNELASQYGSATTEGIELGIRLSHQDLASIIGATRETVTTLLGEMQNEGLLKIRRRKLVLLDMQRLAAECEGREIATPSPNASPSSNSPPPPHTRPQRTSSLGEACR